MKALCRRQEHHEVDMADRVGKCDGERYVEIPKYACCTIHDNRQVIQNHDVGQLCTSDKTLFSQECDGGQIV
jgi:hypothetical protein